MEQATVDIQKRIGIIAREKNGWAKELNIVAWNGRPAKYDIRSWDETHERMSRGVTLTEDEAKALLKVLKDEFE